MSDIPEGLTAFQLRNHPVSSMLAAAAGGGLPSEAELDQLKLPPAARRQVADACRATAAMRAGGENKAAREQAKADAAAIVGSLAPEYRDPDYARPPEPDTHDPHELAEGIQRW